jgi:hypothetical protein
MIVYPIIFFIGILNYNALVQTYHRLPCYQQSKVLFHNKHLDSRNQHYFNSHMRRNNNNNVDTIADTSSTCNLNKHAALSIMTMMSTCSIFMLPAATIASAQDSLQLLQGYHSRTPDIVTGLFLLFSIVFFLNRLERFLSSF